MTDASLRRCRLSKWGGDKTKCRWCAKALKGRQSRWCSAKCTREMLANHYWSYARAAARRRDKNKCKCGSNGTTYREKKLRGLQVHHKKPVNGKHGTSGCHHHLPGLVTLCKPCHLEIHRSLSLKEAA